MDNGLTSDNVDGVSVAMRCGRLKAAAEMVRAPGGPEVVRDEVDFCAGPGKAPRLRGYSLVDELGFEYDDEGTCVANGGRRGGSSLCPGVAVWESTDAPYGCC